MWIIDQILCTITLGRPTARVGQTNIWVGQARIWVYHGLPGLIARTAPACSEGPNDAIITKFSTVVNLTYVMTYANFGWYRLNGGHSAAVQNLPFSHDFNGWPYSRQAQTCCRDCVNWSAIIGVRCRKLSDVTGSRTVQWRVRFT